MLRCTPPSFAQLKCATPLFKAVPRTRPTLPKSLTFSCVTVFTTFGPVTNMNDDVPSTIKIKSVMAGEYTAPPAHYLTMAEIPGITPLPPACFPKIYPQPPSAQHAFLYARSRPRSSANHRTHRLHGCAHDAQFHLPHALHLASRQTQSSLASWTYTNWLPIASSSPQPSPGGDCSPGLNSHCGCTTNLPSSSIEPHPATGECAAGRER